MMHFFDTESRSKARIAAAFVLTFALLLCHGAMGSLHLVPMESHTAPTSHEVHEAHSEHASEGIGSEGIGSEGIGGDFFSAHHEAEVSYFAVVSLFFLAALLFALRTKFERLPAKVTERASGEPFTVPILRPPRGPTLSSIQVFRL